MKWTLSSLRLSAAAVVTATLLALGGAFGMGARPADALTNCTVADLAIDAEEQAFLTLINNYRGQNGLGTLTMSINLNRAASWMVVDLGTKNYWSHTDSLGRSPSTRAKDCGSPQGVGENLTAGTVRDTAQEAFDSWKASSGHNANMLNGSYKQIGIARFYAPNSTYKWYWATDFSMVNDGTNAATGTTTPPPAPVNAPAALTSPTNGSTLPGTSVKFTWNAGTGVSEYWVYVGTTKGGATLYNKQMGTSLSATVSGLPRDGRTIYLRLWSRIDGAWQYKDYSFRAAR
jgi:hypothetical protein